MNDDLKAREAEILGKPQRIEPLRPEEFDDDALKMVLELRSSFGAGQMDEVPEVMRLMLRAPGLFRAQMQASIELVGKGAISPRERELAILRCGWLCRAPYEWGEHVNISKRVGITSEEIERVAQGSSAPGWTEHEAAILKAVEEMLSDQYITDETWATLSKIWTDRQLMELPILIGAYFMTAIQQNSIRVRLAPTNPGLSHR
jgi:4-carboxymuconolactone decarboxylase